MREGRVPQTGPEGRGQEFGFLYVRCEDARGF